MLFISLWFQLIYLEGMKEIQRHQLTKNTIMITDNQNQMNANIGGEKYYEKWDFGIV